MRHGEQGSGLLSAVIGVGVVAALIGLMANVALGLWIRSTVDSVAYDAARAVATTPGVLDSPETALSSQRMATARARTLLGRYGEQVSLEFVPSGSADVIALHVRAPGTKLLPRMIRGGAVVGAIDRTIRVQVEDP